MVWQDVERVVKHFPEFKETFALIGNLRSAFGINILLYNLALNPHITEVVIWGPDKLSNTPIGIVGKESLLDLWTHGFKADDKTALKIVEEIDTTILEKILRNVKITEKSKETTLDIAQFEKKNNVYMDPVVFPEFVIKAEDTLPSEKYTYLIRAPKGAEAYLHLLNNVWNYGEITSIDADSEDVKEIRDAIVVVENENINDISLPAWLTENSALSITPDSLDQYYKSQFSDELYRKEIFPGVTTFERPRDYSYLYAELMYAFPRQEIVDKTIHFFFKEFGYIKTKNYLLEHSEIPTEKAQQLITAVENVIFDNSDRLKIIVEALIPRFNQVENVINRIKSKPQDLDKEIVLWDQRYHTHIESGRPCVYKLSFSVRHDIIDVHAFMRTHDIGKAWFFNFYGIAKLLARIAIETGKKTGVITMESQSAHIYKRDWDVVKEIIQKEIQDNPPRMFFDPERDGDPRGIVNVAVVDGKIKIKLQDMTTGKQLFETDGRTARELLYKIKHFQLISRIDHGIFIGGELAKAEICLKLGIPYKYDNPINLPNGEKIMP